MGGLTVVIYEWIFPVRHQTASAGERHMRRHRFHIFALLTAPLLFVALVGATRMNPIYCAILSLMSGGIATCYCRPDLMPKMAGSAFWFVGFYFAYLLTLVAIYPDYVRLVWNLPAISGVVVLGILSLLKIPSEGEFKQGEKLILNLHERAKRAAFRSTLLTLKGRLTIASFAQRTATGWKLQTIGSTTSFTVFPRLALDSVGIPFAGVTAAMGTAAVYAFLAEPAVSLRSPQLSSTSSKGKTILSGGLKLMNQGTGADGQFKLSYFLSDTDQIDGSAKLLGTRLETAPGVGGERGVTFKFSSPEDVSGKFLIAQLVHTDPAVPALVVGGGVLAVQIP